MCHSLKQTFDLTKCIDKEVRYVAFASIDPENLCNGNVIQSKYGMRRETNVCSQLFCVN